MERQHYLDVAKGLLILLVVMHHLPMVANQVIGIESPVLSLLNKSRVLYTPFFMASFFVITGMCTDFDKSIQKYLNSNFKSILIPAFCLGFINEWLQLIRIGCMDPIQYAKLGFHTFLTDGGPFWFLAALFVAKFFYRIIYCVNNKYICMLLSLSMMVIGVIANNLSLKEYWQVYHAFALLPFLGIGKFLKGITLSKKSILVCWVGYFIALLTCKLYSINIPSVTQIINLTVIEIPLFLFMATTGTIVIISFSKFINTNRIIEYYGINSIIVYGLHLSVLAILTELFRNMSAYDNTLLSLMAVLFSYLLSLLVLSLFIKVLNKPFLKVLIGKF